MNKKEKQELEEIFQTFKADPLILKMKEISMHRGSNCYVHSFTVAKIAVNRVKDDDDYNHHNILIGAILHDYYLYDWRVEKDKLKKHGSNHPLIAEENAKRDFHISPEVAEIIRCHMWPLTPKLFPKSKEAKLVNIVDDEVATKETFHSKKYKQNHQDKYYRFIEKLFD